MKERCCFWSIARGSSSRVRACEMVASARRVGVFKEFHIWTDGSVEGAICHRLRKVRDRGALLPLNLLREAVAKLHYDYFIWLAPNTLFTHVPNDILRVLHGAPVHASLEYDAALPSKLHPDWGPCSLANFTRLMAFNGVHSRAIFTVNDAFWIVHHDAIKTVDNLARGFWWFCGQAGYRFGFAPLLAYVTQMLCGNPYLHRLRESADIWAPVRTRGHLVRTPPGGVWKYVDYFSGEVLTVKPALVHPLRLTRAGPA